MAVDIVVKAHDTYPPLVSVLYDTTLGTPGKAIDLSSATAVKLLMKGQSVLVTGACTKLTAATPTANTATGSNVLVSVSAFTNIVKGSGVIGAGIPLGAVVGDFDAIANTITLTDSTGAALAATATATGITLTVNKGTVQYNWALGDTSTIDTYNIEFEITWGTGPPVQTQTVPNNGYRSLQVVADLENA